jgi:hypothetical protein
MVAFMLQDRIQQAIGDAHLKIRCRWEGQAAHSIEVRLRADSSPHSPEVLWSGLTILSRSPLMERILIGHRLLTFSNAILDATPSIFRVTLTYCRLAEK